ncbi:MAG: ABC transporter substrate-binding protein [Candidatus Faecenecus gallistercoris]|nr:ABC transporter substrate-binding protein [Bacillota bacterium]MDY4050636.1 ABC transporter substrate-binding protein [Candidatus Faecenecus gallistercoris]
MKKRLIITGVILLLIGVITALTMTFSTPKEDDNLTTINLAEVSHTIFYAPQYAAIQNGYFEEEGMEINLILTPGADKVAAALLSKDADIGLSGSEATIYVYNGGEQDYLKTFAQLTQKDGSFLVSRTPIENFTLEDLRGKTVIGGRRGGMPEMTFEYVLRQNGMDPKTDLTIDTSVEFAAMGGAFIGGDDDFVTLFEPTALEVEQQGYGYVVASIGELGGVVPYTSYSARISFIEENPDLIAGFNRAVQKGLDYVHSHSDEEVAKTILSFFPDTSLNDLTEVVGRYREINAWPTTTSFTEESFNHLQDIMIDAGELEEKVPYSELSYPISE